MGQDSPRQDIRLPRDPLILPAWLRPATRSAAASATIPAAATALRSLRTGFVHGQAPAPELKLVELVDGLLGRFVRAHLDKAEPAGPARGHVAHDGDLFDIARACK